MPNGHDKNWIRVLGAIEGFRIRHGRWPTRVRVFPGALADLRHLFSPRDFAKVTAKIQLVPDGAPMIAEDDTGATYNYGHEGFQEEKPNPRAAEWLGVAPKKRRASRTVNDSIEEAIDYWRSAYGDKPDEFIAFLLMYIRHMTDREREIGEEVAESLKEKERLEKRLEDLLPLLKDLHTALNTLHDAHGMFPLLRMPCHCNAHQQAHDVLMRAALWAAVNKSQNRPDSC